MANACLVVDNNADAGTVTASSQALTMPASNLLNPHPSVRWRSLTNADHFVLDKGAAISADTAAVFGLTCGATATVRLRLSSIDATGAAGDILDTGVLASGDPHFDVGYGSFVWRLAASAAWRFLRFDISDPDGDYVEAGCVLDGLSTQFTYNFAPGGGFKHVDRSRSEKSASGMTLIFEDDVHREVELTFPTVSSPQRYGAIERLDRIAGRKRNVLLISDTASSNLPRDSIFGLVTDQTPVAFGQALDVGGLPLFSKQFRIEERV